MIPPTGLGYILNISIDLLPMDLLMPNLGFVAITFFLLIFGSVILYMMYRRLTLPAFITALFIGALIGWGGGPRGIFLLFTFFSLAVWATSHKKHLKAGLSPDGKHPQERTVGQVLANGGVAAIMGAFAIMDPQNGPLYELMLSASLAAALSDTWSSELGMVYGRNFYNILTFKRDQKGLDGVVSREGTWLGIAGAAIIALFHAGVSKESVIVLIAGFTGNLADSLMGATLERQRVIGNDMVNFLNTMIAALTGLILYYCL